MINSVSRSWFAVFPYPETHGYSGTPEDIIDQLKNEWIKENVNRKGFWAYCISEQGMPHIHMILESSVAMRFSAIKKAYPQAHLEPTKGSKEQILAYIKKEPPFDEKGEKVVVFISHGNIEGFKKHSISCLNETLQMIESLIDNGMTPEAIMSEDIRLRREETLIKKAYFAKRYKETPPIREVKVIWHCGNTGTGKSYAYLKLCEKYGDDKVYLFTDYANKGVGGFDGYMGEPILFMDELKKGALPFELLLIIMQGYRTQIHCRYANSYALWDEVHISSIYAPEEIYISMVDRELHEKDPIMQLMRRINLFVYHYMRNKEYKTFELTGEKYKTYKTLVDLALYKNEFKNFLLEDIPFDMATKEGR